MTENARPLYLFDLDGTIALIGHRRHLVEGPHPRWQQFEGECVRDEPNLPVLLILDALQADGNDVWIVSGRSAVVREQTVRWLERHGVFIGGDELMMRPEGDSRPDEVLKQEFLDRMLDVDRKRLMGVFDDRDKVVAMWRRNGIPCFQVAPGDF